MDHRSSERQARPQIPQRPAAAAQPQVKEEYAVPRANKLWTPSADKTPRRKKWPFIVAVVAVVVLLTFVAWWYLGYRGGLKQPASNRYQAVFLDNGQVFFGKLKNVEGTYLVLENAYNTRKQEVPKNATDEQKAAIENNVSLARVGSEVYGPEGTLSIRSEQVLFWQNLTEDSKVSSAIKNAE